MIGKTNASGINTSDATATEDDIRAGKTAYIAVGKVVGSMEVPPYIPYATPFEIKNNVADAAEARYVNINNQESSLFVGDYGSNTAWDEILSTSYLVIGIGRNDVVFMAYNHRITAYPIQVNPYYWQYSLSLYEFLRLFSQFGVGGGTPEMEIDYE